MPRSGPWPDDVKDRALDVYRADGLAAAHRATGVPRPTISRWAHAAGIPAPAEHSTTQTEAANDARRRALAAARERRRTLLAMVGEHALNRTLEQVQQTGGPGGELLPVRDLVGVWTRAEHDLALLEGRATENAAISVTFNVPTASPTPPPVVAEADLAALTP